MSHPLTPDNHTLEQNLPTPAATEAFGALLAPTLEAGLIIWLDGNLGAGKTTLTRGLLRALGYTGNVKSPTYTLLEPYELPALSLYHFDFYRFNSPDEFLEAGLEEYFTGQGVCLVEWAEKAAPYLATPDLLITLSVQGEGRLARCTAQTSRGSSCLKKISDDF